MLVKHLVVKSQKQWEIQMDDSLQVRSSAAGWRIMTKEAPSQASRLPAIVTDSLELSIKHFNTVVLCMHPIT